MALLQDEKYIKMLPYGDFVVYKTQGEREIARSAPEISDVIAKYDEMLTELRDYFYQKFIDYPDFIKKHSWWPEFYEEHPTYKMGVEILVDRMEVNIFYKFAHKIDEPKAQIQHAMADEKENFLKAVYDDKISYEDFCKMEFPYIREHFPTLDSLKIKIAESGNIPIDEADVKEVYEIVKEKKFFGETRDV